MKIFKPVCLVVLVALAIGAVIFFATHKDSNSSNSKIESDTNSLKLQSGEVDTFASWLPNGVKKLNAETTKNEKLEKVIKEYYDIPEEYLKDTKYYYNFVDLDNDGVSEIFVVVMGMYVSGSGGSSALWINSNNLSIIQAFTLVNTPIIISDNVQNGYKSLIMQRSGGGSENEFVILKNNNGIYTNVVDAETIENIDEITGTAIISNNLIDDLENDNYLTLEN